MHFRGRRPWLVLLLLLVIGLASYRVGVQVWETYRYRAALAAIERRDFRQAGSALDRCLERNPDDLTVRLLAAQTARRRRDYAAALSQSGKLLPRSYLPGTDEIGDTLVNNAAADPVNFTHASAASQELPVG